MIPEDREYLNEKRQAALAGAPFNIEYRICLEGEVKWVHKELVFNMGLATITRDEIIFRVGGWINKHDVSQTLRQHVNRAIVKTLKGAGVIFPYQKEQVELESKAE